MKLTLEQLWGNVKFTSNPKQKEAILHTEGPLFLTAGQGSDKTRVLLWRTLNQIVFKGVRPDEIILITFTEKAALQLREGLRAYLGQASKHIDDTIAEFAETVDKIENGEFQAPPLEKLMEIIHGTRRRFATQICRNCDARFSCPSYREYQGKTNRSGSSNFKQYFSDLGALSERNEWTTSSSTDGENEILKNLQNPDDNYLDALLDLNK